MDAAAAAVAEGVVGRENEGRRDGRKGIHENRYNNFF